MLIHGVTFTAELNWGKVFAPLARHFHVAAIDLRGHGDGISTGSRFRLEDCADDIAALAQVLGVGRFVAVGYSMGGMVAQLLYRRHPSLLSGLVLCATARNVRPTAHEKSNGKKNTGRSGKHLRASSKPVSVVVEMTHGRPGWCRRKTATTWRSRWTSPTLTPWNQTAPGGPTDAPRPSSLS